MERLKIVLVDGNVRISELAIKYFKKEYDIQVFSNGALALDYIQENEFDLIILDVVLPGIDGFTILEYLSKNTQNKKIIVASNTMNKKSTEKALELGVDLFVSKPFDFNELEKNIHNLTNENEGNKSDESMIKIITKLLKQIGVPVHLKGYHYLREGIHLVVTDISYLQNLTNVLYPEIAKIDNSNAARVERGIRHAIEVSWNRGNQNKIYKLFGYNSSNGKYRPSNKEFIATIADVIKIEHLS